MDSTPAASAPAGYHVNMHEPETKGLEPGLWVGIVGVVMSTGFLVIRVYTKAVLAKKFELADLCIVLSWILAMSLQAIFLC